MKLCAFRGINIRFLVSLFGAAGTTMRLAAWIAAAALAGLALSPPAHAALVPVVVNAQLDDFNGEAGNSRNAYTGQGARTTAGAHVWNDLPIFQSSTYTGLVDSSGAANATTFNVNGDGFTGITTGNYLLDGSRSVGPGTGIPLGLFTIGGLTPNATYDLYLYAYGEAGSVSQPTGIANQFDITSGGTGVNANPQSTSGAVATSGVDYTSSTISPTALEI
jgi:hypothetical protein